MIPRAYITEWRNTTGWQSDAQIEQDLIICRVLVEIFSDKVLAENLAFRGGTALHKLHLGAPLRYSEDIDLVQVKVGKIGPLIDRLRGRITFLDKPKVKQSGFNNTIVFNYKTEIAPVATMKLKVEINCREHFAVYGYKKLPFSVSSGWFHGACNITTFEIAELLGTKTRALYQRKKGRDLFDLYYVLTKAKPDPKRIRKAFHEYMKSEGHKISSKQFIRNMEGKMKEDLFINDVKTLLKPGTEFNMDEAWNFVRKQLIELL